MYGAMLGDIIGEPYEFDMGTKSKEFPLFSKGAAYTDDSLLSVAVAEALLDAKDREDLKNMTPADADKEIEKMITKSIRKWAHDPRYKHISAEFGGMFQEWLESRNPKPYNSFGNGSAMRVSAAGWLYDTLEETLHHAKLTANVTHNHPDGIKGAQATAAVIFLARTGHSKEEIKNYITQTFGYNLNRTVADIRRTYYHMEKCERSVPEAIICFLEGNSYEDVIRNTVSLRGDTDTNACIAGSMAEAFYGVPAVLKDKCRENIEPGMLAVLNRLNKKKLGVSDVSEAEIGGKIYTNFTDFIAREKAVGDVNVANFTEALERNAVDENIPEAGRKFAAFAAGAVAKGHRISDIQALWHVKKVLDAEPANLSNEAKNALYEARSIFETVTKKDGMHINPQNRLIALKKVKRLLSDYAEKLTDTKLRLTIEDVAAAGLDERIKTALTPAEKARMCGTVRDLYDRLDSVDPSMMRSSESFRTLKSMMKEFAELAERTDMNDPDQRLRYHELRQRTMTQAKKYIDYKKTQYDGGRSRSHIEYLRVTTVESVLEKLTLDNFDPAQRPADMKLHDLLQSARKDLALGKNKVEASAILYAAKKKKDTNEPLSADSVKVLANTLKSSNRFKNALQQTTAEEMEDAVNNGTIEQKINTLAARSEWHRSPEYAALKAIRTQERSARRAAAEQLRAQRLLRQQNQQNAQPNRPVNAQNPGKIVNAPAPKNDSKTTGKPVQTGNNVTTGKKTGKGTNVKKGPMKK
ncbi:ADP-ribosylglycohydrolase [Eubacterium ruminantium]|nr:ADP-ribosylglycohydrolase [Eubacterium ruminantium]